MSAQENKPGAMPEGEDLARLVDIEHGDPAHASVMLAIRALDETFAGPMIDSAGEARDTMMSVLITAMGTMAGAIFGKLLADGKVGLEQLELAADAARGNFIAGATMSMSLNIANDAEGRA